MDLQGVKINITDKIFYKKNSKNRSEEFIGVIVYLLVLRKIKKIIIGNRY